MSRKTTHNGTTFAHAGVILTLHDEPGCTLLRRGGKLVGWWVNTPDRGRLATAVKVLQPNGTERRAGAARYPARAVELAVEALAEMAKDSS